MMRRIVLDSMYCIIVCVFLLALVTGCTHANKLVLDANGNEYGNEAAYSENQLSPLDQELILSEIRAKGKLPGP